MPVSRSRAGLTAPELLNMLVLGAILALIVYGQRSALRGPAPDPRLAPMRAALNDLKAAELRHHGQTGRYTLQLDSLDVIPAAGVTRTVDRADSTGWHAVATAEGSAARCEVAVGAVSADTVVCNTGPVR